MEILNHPHAALLAEWRIAIDHFVPTTPEDLKKKAVELYEAHLRRPDTEEATIRQDLQQIGRLEYPHRHAFLEATEAKRPQMLLDLVLKELPSALQERLTTHIASGGDVVSFAHSEAFERDLSPNDRVVFERALLSAQEETETMLASSVSATSEAYKALWKKWEDTAVRLETLLSNIEALKGVDPKWTGEIQERVDRFRDGFSLVEPDPTERELQEELEYWKGTLGITEES